MLANVNLANDTKLLANNGRVIVIGSRGEVTINPRELMGWRASIRAFTLWAITAAEEADIHSGLFAAALASEIIIRARVRAFLSAVAKAFGSVSMINGSARLSREIHVDCSR